MIVVAAQRAAKSSVIGGVIFGAGWLVYIDAAATGMLREEGGARPVAITAVLLSPLPLILAHTSTSGNPPFARPRCAWRFSRRMACGDGAQRRIVGAEIRRCGAKHARPYGCGAEQVPLVIATIFVVMLNAGVDLDSFRVPQPQPPRVCETLHP